MLFLSFGTVVDKMLGVHCRITRTFSNGRDVSEAHVAERLDRGQSKTSTVLLRRGGSSWIVTECRQLSSKAIPDVVERTSQEDLRQRHPEVENTPRAASV